MMIMQGDGESFHAAKARAEALANREGQDVSLVDSDGVRYTIQPAHDQTTKRQTLLQALKQEALLERQSVSARMAELQKAHDRAMAQLVRQYNELTGTIYKLDHD